MPYSFNQGANEKGMLDGAMQTGAWFVPIACSGDRLIVIPSAWDRSNDH